MAISIREVVSSDTMSELIDKVNYNFDQLLLNGGGPAGQLGDQGIPGNLGPDGVRGSVWYTGSLDPEYDTSIIDPRSGDHYLKDDGYVWDYTGTVWTNTGISIKGDTGAIGSSIYETGGSSVVTGSAPYNGEDFAFIPSSSTLYTATTTTDVVSLLVGGYPSGGPATLPELTPIDITYANAISSADGGALFVHSHDGSVPQIVLSNDSGTNSIDYMPKLYSDSKDALKIYVPADANSVITAGITLTTTDTDFDVSCARDLSIIATGSPESSWTSDFDSSIGNISILSKDVNTSYLDSNRLFIENAFYDALNIKQNNSSITLGGAADGSGKSGTRYITLFTQNYTYNTNTINIGRSGSNDIEFITENNIRFYNPLENKELLFNGADGKVGLGYSGVVGWIGNYPSTADHSPRTNVIHVKDSLTSHNNTINTVDYNFIAEKVFNNYVDTGSSTTNYKGGFAFAFSGTNSLSSSSFIEGFRSDINFTSAASAGEIEAMQGFYNDMYITGSTGTGSSTNTYGFRNSISATGYYLENVYGYHSYIINPNPFQTTIGNSYHLYLSGHSGTFSGSTYGMYQDGEDDINYFQGNVGFGVVEPEYEIHVSGSMVFATSGYIYNEMNPNGAGYYLTVKSGEPLSGASNVDGGNLNLIAADTFGRDDSRGGNVNITAGLGNTRGGIITLQGGYADTIQAGSIDLIAGDGGTTALPGNISLTAGTSTTIAGGDITVLGGPGETTGGNISITAGIGDTGDGGQLDLYAGDSSTLLGGNTNVYGGSGTTFGGTLTLKGGTAVAGGWVYLIGGDATTGNGGRVYIKGGTTASGEHGSVNIASDGGTGNAGVVTIGTYITPASTTALVTITNNDSQPRNVIDLFQDDPGNPIMGISGTSGGQGTIDITTQGNGSVVGPMDKDTTEAAWGFEGMIKVEINGSTRYMPYYSYVAAGAPV